MKSYLTKIQEEIGHKYWLGKVLEIHEIKDYGFVEYLPYTNISDKSKGFESVPHFSGYIKGHSIGVSFDSLESALAGTMAYRFDGANSRAGSLFIRMISDCENYPLVPRQKESED